MSEPNLPPEAARPLWQASPDTPGMPELSPKTAWDFLPTGWHQVGDRAVAPYGFVPATQLDAARLGLVTAEVRQVAEQEGHLTPEDVREK